MEPCQQTIPHQLVPFDLIPVDEYENHYENTRRHLISLADTCRNYPRLAKKVDKNNYLKFISFCMDPEEVLRKMFDDETDVDEDEDHCSAEIFLY